MNIVQTYEELVEFLQKGFAENRNLDYKREIPEKNLSKTIASFANSKGGIIILGVEEDKETGKPIKWEGVDSDTKTREKIDQEISKITPSINCNVIKIDHKENKNKVFYVLNIPEGDNPPYYVINDKSCWIRRGTIRTEATPDDLKFLIEKKGKYIREKEILLEQSKIIYNNILEYEFRKNNINLKAEDYFKKYPYNSLINLTAYPVYPNDELDLKDILRSIHDLKVYYDSSSTFMSSNTKPLMDNLIYFYLLNKEQGFFEFQLINKYGFLLNKFNALIHFLENKRKFLINFSYLFLKLYAFLLFLSKIIKKYKLIKDYILEIELLNTSYISYTPIKPLLFYDDLEEFILSKYNFYFKIESFDLIEEKNLIGKYMPYLIKEIYWKIGISNIDDITINKNIEEIKRYIK